MSCRILCFAIFIESLLCGGARRFRFLTRVSVSTLKRCRYSAPGKQVGHHLKCVSSPSPTWAACVRRRIRKQSGFLWETWPSDKNHPILEALKTGSNDTQMWCLLQSSHNVVCLLSIDPAFTLGTLDPTETFTPASGLRGTVCHVFEVVHRSHHDEHLWQQVTGLAQTSSSSCCFSSIASKMSSQGRQGHDTVGPQLESRWAIGPTTFSVAECVIGLGAGARPGCSS